MYGDEYNYFNWAQIVKCNSLLYAPNNVRVLRWWRTLIHNTNIITTSDTLIFLCVYYHWFDIYLCGLVIILINLTINLVDAENRDTWYVRCLVPSLEARRAVCQDVVRNIAGNTKV